MTSRIIAALAIALGATAAGAQTPSGGEGGSGAAAPPVTAPAAPAAPAQAPAPTPAPMPPAASPTTVSPPAQAPVSSAAPQQGTPATVIDTQDLESLLGRGVRSAQGDELGRVIDVLIDKEGHPRAAIIDFGGFLGVGTRKIAVDWRALRFTTDGKERRLSVALTRNQVRVSPEYKSGEPIVVLGPASGTTPPEGDPTAGAAQPAAQSGGAATTPAAQPAAVAPAPPAPAPAVAPQAAPPAAPQATPPAAPASQQAPDK